MLPLDNQLKKILNEVTPAYKSASKTRNMLRPDIASYINETLSPKTKYESRHTKNYLSMSLNSNSSSMNNKIARKLKSKEVYQSLNLNQSIKAHKADHDLNKKVSKTT